MPLTKKTIGFLGAGRMAEALVNGLISSRLVSPGQITVSDRDKKRLVLMAEKYEVKVFNKNYEVAKASDIILLAVKPPDSDGVLEEIAPEVTKEKLVISLVAGKTIGAILESLRRGGTTHHVPIVRAMPNTPALIGEGTTGIFAESACGKEGLKMAKAVFNAVGTTVEVKDESLMDAVTGISGSGPAYMFLFMETLVEAGIHEGLTEEDALALVLKTALGAAKMAATSTKGLGELIAMVASPGGTTVEALKVFEHSGLKKIVDSAVKAAVKRSRELSGTN
ncbi:MAG: pyrroline-5-carboxylate reductase [Deltaproteobacteria bacterium]|nr:pyrroline-5-carboxylate reductase [Deltaproteobacteria bacterium]